MEMIPRVTSREFRVRLEAMDDDGIQDSRFTSQVSRCTIRDSPSIVSIVNCEYEFTITNCSPTHDSIKSPFGSGQTDSQLDLLAAVVA